MNTKKQAAVSIKVGYLLILLLCIMAGVMIFKGYYLLASFDFGCAAIVTYRIKQLKKAIK